MARTKKIASTYVEVDMRSKKFLKQTKENTKQLRKLERQMAKQARETRKWNSTMRVATTVAKNFGAVLIGGLGVSALTSKFTMMVDAFEQGDKRIRALEFSVNKFGDELGITQDQVDNLVVKLTKLGGMDLNQSREAANKLLTIAQNSEIAGDNIERIAVLAADMAAGGWGDIIGNVEEIAEVFALPAEAVTTLEKYNVAFLDGEKKKLEALVDTGNEMKAMELIFDKMEAKFGGAAEAITGGFHGAVVDAKTEIGLMNEAMGELIVKTFNLEGAWKAVGAAAKAHREVLENRLERFRPDFEEMGKVELKEFAEKYNKILDALGDTAEMATGEFENISEERWNELVVRYETWLESIEDLLADLNKNTLNVEIGGEADETNESLKELNTSLKKAKSAVDEGTEGEAEARIVARQLNAEKEKETEKAKEAADALQKLKDAADRAAKPGPSRTTGDGFGAPEIEESRNASRGGLTRDSSGNVITPGGSGTTDTDTADHPLFAAIGRQVRDNNIQLEASINLGNQMKEQQEEYMRSNDFIASEMTGLVQKMHEFGQNGKTVWQDFQDAGLSAAETIANKLADKALWEPFNKLLDGLIDKFVGGIGTAPGADPQWFGGFFRAEGGPVQRGSSYVVGEKGPEIFKPKQSGYVFSNKDSMGMGNTTIISPNIYSNDPAAVKSAFIEMMPMMSKYVQGDIVYEGTRPGPINTQFGRGG